MARTYHELQRQIAVLQQQADAERKIGKVQAIAQVKGAIDLYGLTPSDLFGARAATRRDAGLDARATTRRAAYSDGRGGHWGGRGKQPAWLRCALAAGAKLEDFKIGPVPSALARAIPSAAKKNREGASSRVIVANVAMASDKYVDGMGNAWSGKGPQPKWLKVAISSGKMLEDFAVA
jgi:DNA-binding protein H-NS